MPGVLLTGILRTSPRGMYNAGRDERQLLDAKVIRLEGVAPLASAGRHDVLIGGEHSTVRAELR